MLTGPVRALTSLITVAQEVGALVVPSGQRVALVGSGGAGNSTPIKLIARFYDPEVGRVLIDGTDVRDFDLVCLGDRRTRHDRPAVRGLFA
jgi:ABC-type multidrug transport system fused ATPase/permease subunit